MRRWKWGLCVLALLVLPTLAFGFDFGFGFKLGVNFPYMAGAGFDNSLVLPESNNFIMTFGAPGGIPPVRFCFSAGGFVDLGIFKFFAIQPEVLFTMLGAGYKTNVGKEYFHSSVLEVPILFKFKLLTHTGGGLILFVGPDVMFPLAAQFSRRENDGTEVTQDITWQWKEAYQKLFLSFGAIAGVGFQFANGAFIEGRYFIGAFQADDDLDWATFSMGTLSPGSRTWTQNYIQVMLGFEI